MAPAVIETREFKPSTERLMKAMAHDARAQGDAWLRKGLLVLSVVMAAWIAYELLTTASPRLFAGVATGLVAAGLFFFALRMLPRITERLPYNRGAFTPRRYRFDAETLFLETSDGVTLKAPYRTFSKISLAPDWILFYESFPGFITHLVPSDAFESKEQESTVRNWLASHV